MFQNQGPDYEIHYFLSRPRRFGKSLLSSTLKAYFPGRQDLFNGLAIAGMETGWMEYPVLHLDLNPEKYSGSNALNDRLEMQPAAWEALIFDVRRGDAESFMSRLKSFFANAKFDQIAKDTEHSAKKHPAPGEAMR